MIIRIGENHPNCKLEKEKVIQIRNLKGIYTQRKAAKIFGISQSSVNLIYNEKHWVFI